MNTQGFYKKDGEQIIFTNNTVQGPNYLLVISDKDEYDYPVDGWIYAASLDEAIAYFAANNSSNIQPFDVQPENYKLAANKNDELEFGKLITLLTLGLQQNRFLPTTEIMIWDHVKMSHPITVQRFLEIMVDYGLYCYSKRS